ncbi:MAG: GNAT family N-acetyltransferase [Rhodobacter sp.]|nr:GNAT family N-acetyltransferase [Rhodobacter sp.]
MRLTAAKPRDAEPLAAILADWKDETRWLPDLHSREEDAGFLARLIDTTDVIVLRNWRGARGFLARDDQVVHALYIARQTRGQGHGRRLLDAAKAQSARLTLWTFQANTRARAFYAREGFVEVEETDGAGNDEKLPDVRLEWHRSGA